MSGAEAVALTDALELDPQLLLELLEVGPLASDYAHAKAGAMLEHDFTPGFPLRHRLKEARLALAAARSERRTAADDRDRHRRFPTMTASTPPRRVVVGYGGSAASDAALERAAEVAGENGRVYVVHAYARPRNWLGHPNYQRRLDALDKAKSTIKNLCPETGGPLDRVAWEPEIIAGDPAKAIAAVATARHADEIVTRIPERVGGRHPAA